MPQAFCREKAKENVLFTYLYRDYGNYKKYSQIVFANPDHLSVSQVKHRFEDAVVAAFPEAAENQFCAEALCLPTTYFSDGRTDIQCRCRRSGRHRRDHYYRLDLRAAIRRAAVRSLRWSELKREVWPPVAGP